DGLLHHPYLDTINMVVDPDLQVLCCLICQVALPPDHISGHIENAHRGLRLDDDKYTQAIFDAKIIMTLPTSIAGGRYTKAYKGLKGLNRHYWRVSGDNEITCDHQEVIDRMRKEMAEVTAVEQVAQESRMALFEVTDELILQRLNSPDPIKEGINNTPLHRHQETATLKEYIRPIAALLAMLMRTDEEEGYFIPLPASLGDAIYHLQESLTNEDGII
ncbi:hypothetical protein M405DRAFT_707375, partial [Rhizopogon salebrosus TDB-379]